MVIRVGGVFEIIFVPFGDVFRAASLFKQDSSGIKALSRYVRRCMCASFLSPKMGSSLWLLIPVLQKNFCVSALRCVLVHRVVEGL